MADSCERCRSTVSGFELVDYCNVCSKNLCDGCMASGCCGHVPAKSGFHAEEEADVARQQAAA